MNNLIERFFDLESRQRTMLCAILVLLVAAGYWSFVYSGRRAEMASLREKVEALRDQRNAKEHLVANLDEAERQRIAKQKAEQPDGAKR